MKFYDEVLNFVEKNIEDIKSFHPYIYLNYLVVKFYENYDLIYPDEIKVYKRINSHKFDSKLQIHFDDAVKNIYMKLFTKIKGEEKVIRMELFNICDRIYMQKSPSYLKYFKNNLKSYEFMVIVNLGCSLRKIDWTKDFMDKYGNKLIDEYSDDCYNISLANYYYVTKDYERSNSYSNKISKRVAHFYYTSKMLILKCYCEMNDEAGMSFAFENIKQYLKRNTSINSYDEQILKPFISFFSHFMKVRYSIEDKASKKDQAGLLIRKIENYNDTLYSRNWFIRKLKEI